MPADKEDNRRISYVEEGSIGEELGVVPGDILLSIDHIPVKDLFDYRTRVATEYLVMTFRLQDGETFDAEIEKDEDEDIGLSFVEPLLDTCGSCHNNCIFCFIDQLPKGMRSTLYFKDDDLRMSFLTGNYVTLTNLSEDEFDRILSYKLSPMNVSVHATDPEVRKFMMRNRFAGNIMERLIRITQAGISLNCQIVLCPGVNDGPVLEKTMEDLSTLGEKLQSIAVVPVGITKFREENHLYPLSSFQRDTAEAVLRQVDHWQELFLSTRGERLFFAADEFYLRAERPILPASHYEGFPQLENGVGLLSDRRQDMQDGIARRTRMKPTKSTKKSAIRPRVVVLSGVDAKPMLNSFAEALSVLYNINLEVKAVVNHFFGEKITVTGLLTGSDIVSAISSDRENGIKDPDAILVMDCMLKADEEIFLDDMTIQMLRDTIAIPIVISQSTGEGLLSALDEYTGLFLKKSQRREKRKGNHIHE